MIAYHGTIRQNARKISVKGLVPRRPSKRVWFAVAKSYALRRDNPIVLRCDLNLHEL